MRKQGTQLYPLPQLTLPFLSRFSSLFTVFKCSLTCEGQGVWLAKCHLKVTYPSATCDNTVLCSVAVCSQTCLCFICTDKRWNSIVENVVMGETGCWDCFANSKYVVSLTITVPCVSFPRTGFYLN